jgi:glycosyltransferase involved in cell wall biosynthesis
MHGAQRSQCTSAVESRRVGRTSAQLSDRRVELGNRQCREGRHRKDTIIAAMPTDVSVVIPFFNPGANIEDCLESLIDQSLAHDRFEVILVDDGSTDGSDVRVDGWAARHPDLMKVHHIPASGGPARPRNVGIDNATGRYIQFLDADDTLAPRALERLLEVADSSTADVVVGKLSSDFRGIFHPLFRRTVTGRTLADYPLIENLTVCKMFRRDFMLEHDVRFPEGPRYIEDQQICVEAYAHARSVAVVADIACYFYRRRRTGGHHFGDTRIVPADYYRELAAIFDIIDTQVPPAARLSSLTRYYRNEMLGRLRGGGMLRYDDAYRRDVATEVRRLATTRIPPEVHRGLPMFQRTQSALLLDDDLAGLTEFARQLERLRLTATTTAPRWRDGRLLVDLDARLLLGDEPLMLERAGSDWVLPESMAPGVTVEDRSLGSSADTDIDLATVSRADSQLWSTTDGLSLEIDDDGCPRVRCEVSLDPATVLGGTALTTGLWDLRLRVMFGGLTRTAALRPAAEDPPALDAWVTDDTSITAYWTSPSPTLALDVAEWSHALHDLVDDPLEMAPEMIGRRTVALGAGKVRGPSGVTRAAQLILEPVDATEIGQVRTPAELRVAPGGASVQAALPRLPTAVSAWSVWLRIGQIGGAPPRRLPVTITPGRMGRLIATAVPIDDEPAG